MIDYEELTKLARDARIDCLNAVREALQRHIIEGKQLDDFLRTVNGFLGTEMDRAAIERLSTWKTTKPLLRSLLSR